MRKPGTGKKDLTDEEARFQEELKARKAQEKARDTKMKKAKKSRKKIKLKDKPNISITMVGDPHTSKTTILKTFVSDEEATFTGVFNHARYPVTIEKLSSKLVLNLFDTEADELYSRIRALTYKKTDIFFICFSITKPETFNNVLSWYAEVNQLSPYSPIILVGTKKDLRSEGTGTDAKPVSLEEGFAKSQDLIMAYEYVEIEANSLRDVHKLMELALSLVDFKD
eukprot:TRINITY_DN7797_c0_g3_i1.p1 TRINITY_DN7797_c0_g3~~TRINITY_DN7797_c0_g3_i1.p1  ORF type:complete len:240 (-),score=6.24 TRINITY_DN7797_c0_g3_i1:68-742(-)